ncbi:MAG: DUF4340 domain-containing protein [Lachnospiraceae bacterium]|nr:DUF4340 domain-containing protein [Lachnospiraceae bacterium]
MEKKLLRLIIIGLAVCAVLTAAVIVVGNITNKTDSSVKVFIDRQPGEIRSLKVANGYGNYEVYYEDDGYVFDDMPANIVDEEGFFELMNHSCAFGALRVVKENADDLALYGMDAPRSIVVVTFNDGETFKLRIGAEETVTGNYYGMVNDDPNVYLFAEEDMLYFLVGKQTYISTQVTPASSATSPLSAIRDITFSGAALEKPITVKAVLDSDPETQLLAKSFGPATHIVQMKGVYELDQTYGIEILGSVLDIQAVDVIGYNMSDNDLTKLGFDEPYMQVDFSMKKDAETIADYQLKLIPYGEFFLATMKGSGIVFVINPPAFVTVDYTKLCMRWFLAPLRKDLENVTVEYGGSRYVFTSEDTENGDIKAYVNGNEISKDLFFSFYRLVTSAASDGLYLEDTVNEGSPLMTITYNYLDKSKAPDVMNLYSGSVRRVNVEVNGVTEFDMKASFVDAMINAIQNILAGEPIEENW